MQLVGDYAGQRVHVRNSMWGMGLLEFLIACLLHAPSGIEARNHRAREGRVRSPDVRPGGPAGGVERADDVVPTDLVRSCKRDTTFDVAPIVETMED